MMSLWLEKSEAGYYRLIVNAPRKTYTGRWESNGPSFSLAGPDNSWHSELPDIKPGECFEVELIKKGTVDNDD